MAEVHAVSLGAVVGGGAGGLLGAVFGLQVHEIFGGALYGGLSGAAGGAAAAIMMLVWRAIVCTIVVYYF